MNDQSQLLLRSIKGPVIMITIGVLFAADRFTDYHFHQTWPVLLIVVGLLQLLGGRGRKPGYYPPPTIPPTPASGPYNTHTPSGPSSSVVPAPSSPEEPRS